MSEPKAQKDDPLPHSWIEEPDVDTESWWYDDGKNTYPREFVTVNGALFTVDGARELRDELEEVLNDE